jgi:hypothetical protein
MPPAVERDLGAYFCVKLQGANFYSAESGLSLVALLPPSLE